LHSPSVPPFPPPPSPPLCSFFCCCWGPRVFTVIFIFFPYWWPSCNKLFSLSGKKEKERKKESWKETKRKNMREKDGRRGQREREKEALCFQKKSISAWTNCPRSKVTNVFCVGATLNRDLTVRGKKEKKRRKEGEKRKRNTD